MELVRSRGGFSVIEVLLATVILGVLAMGLMSLMSSVQGVQNNLKFRSDADNLQEEIRALLSKADACKNTFAGIPADASTNQDIPALLDDSSNQKYQKGGIYGDRSVTLTSMTLNNYSGSADPAKADLTLVLNVASTKESVGGVAQPRAVNISVEKDGVGKISSCIALAKMSDGIWQRIPGNLNNVFFVGGANGGNVGIGVPDPQSALDVKGDAFLTGGSLVMRRQAPSPTGGEGLGGLHFGGYNGVAYTSGWDGGASIQAWAAYDWSPSDTGTYLAFKNNLINKTWADEVMALDQHGSLGVGMSPIPAAGEPYRVYVRGAVNLTSGWDGNMYHNVTASLNINDNTICDSTGCGGGGPSDRRLKENIQPLDGSLEKILQLQGVSFDWIDKAIYGNQHEVGFIAQDVEKEYPELVKTNPQTGMKSLSYGKMVAPIVESIKTIVARLSGVESETAKLKAENERLRKELEDLKSRMSKLEKKRH